MLVTKNIMWFYEWLCFCLLCSWLDSVLLRHSLVVLDSLLQVRQVPFSGVCICWSFLLLLSDCYLEHLTFVTPIVARHRRTHHLSLPGHTEISETPLCLCCKPDSHQSLIGCDGPCSRWFHYDCTGVYNIPSDEWICLCCTIKNTCSVRVLRHTQKGPYTDRSSSINHLYFWRYRTLTLVETFIFWLYCVGHSWPIW